MKKFICGILALIMTLSLSSLFTACNKTDGDSAETTAATTADNSFPGYSVADISKLSIIYPTGCSSDIQQAVNGLQAAIEEKFGVKLTVRSDYVNVNLAEFAEAENEILIGRCANREESESFGAIVRVNDSGYSLVDKKIVICGGDDAHTIEAIDLFITNVVKASDGNPDSMFYTASMDKMTVGVYGMDSLKINGTNIAEYTIVYPSASSKFEAVHAQKLADAVETASGYRLRIKSDVEMMDKSDKEIRLGATDRNASILSKVDISDDEYYIGKADDGAILLLGKSVNALVGAVEKLIDMTTEGGKDVDAKIGDAITGISASKEFTIMSYNVLCDQLDTGTTRYNNVISDILAQMPDSIGLQEVTGADHYSNWIQHLKDGLGEYYDCVGKQRGDGGNANKGEYSCIFYRKDLYTLKDSGTKWLSDTPDVISKYDESGYNRVMTWARLVRKSDGKEFVHVNTHLAHESNDIAATKQAKVLVELIKQFGDIPVLITGDFNTDMGDKPYEELAAAFTDSKTVAPVTELKTATFKDGKSIPDIVFINDLIYAMKYDVINDRKYEQYVTSDHYPVILKYLI